VRFTAVFANFYLLIFIIISISVTTSLCHFYCARRMNLHVSKYFTICTLEFAVYVVIWQLNDLLLSAQVLFMAVLLIFTFLSVS